MIKKVYLKIFQKLLILHPDSFFFFNQNKPKVIIGSGGYASFPILMAGYI